MTTETVKFRHLTADDRVQIEKGRDGGRTQAEIARALGVHPSTISRELRRGAHKPGRSSPNYDRDRWGLRTATTRARSYSAVHAQALREQRAARSHRAWRMREPLRAWVVEHLMRGWSPQMIAGRLAYEFPDDPSMQISPETLYVWIYAREQRAERLWEYLPRGRKRRRKRPGRRVHTVRADLRVSIHERPEQVAERMVPGHWEADSVVGARGTGNVHTAIERTSRKVWFRKLADGTAASTLAAQVDVFSGVPEQLRLTVTTDNGVEFSEHVELTARTGAAVFFADPYSSWQRGTVEHFNGRFRRYVPKGASFADLEQDELDAIAAELNSQPRGVLGWRTSDEVWAELLELGAFC